MSKLDFLNYLDQHGLNSIIECKSNLIPHVLKEFYSLLFFIKKQVDFRFLCNFIFLQFKLYHLCYDQVCIKGYRQTSKCLGTEFNE